MGASPRDRFKAHTLVVVLLNTALALACGTASPLSPSPIIIPDAVTVAVGAAQVFSVQNATVEQFKLSADHQRWSNCVAVDETFSQPNSIRLIALSRCPDFIYVTASIGSNRSPVAAVLQVR